MCGRFTLISNISDLQLRFGFAMEPPETQLRYNIAPTQQVLTVVNNGERGGEMMRWGLVPSWAKDIKIGNRHQASLPQRVPSSALLGACRRLLRVAARGEAAGAALFLSEVRRANGFCGSLGELAVA